MQDVDKFWQMYRNFEETTNANKDLGRGLIAEVQPRHVAARAEFRARRTRREGLALAVLPVPPRGRPKEASQAAQWRRFIAAERANPHGLDAQSLHARVVHAYETALAPLYRYPDIWIDYASYVADIASGRAMVPNLPSSGGKSGSGGGSMQTGPGSSVGQGAGGGLGNSGANGGAGSQVGSGDGSGTGGDNPANVSEFESVAERAVRALPECVAVSHHISWLWMRFGHSANALSTLDALVKASPSPLGYVHLMRLTRKVSGTGAARKVFAKARRDPLAADPAVFIAAAQMEFIVNKDNKVARNVFEFGLKHFGNNALMIHEFVEWLWGLGDFDHLRVVLKRVMPSIEGPPEIVRKLWERWIELEEAVGDVTTVESVENQWRESGTCHTPTAVADALRRSRFLGLEGMREEELVIAGSTASVTGIAGGGAIGGGIISAGGAGGAGGSAGGAGGGRRDPRTGRRVGGGSTHAGTGAAGGSGSDAHGSGANGSATGAAGGGGSGARNISTPRGGSAMLMPGNSFEEIEGNLRRMGAQMQHINAPPPDYETIVQLVMKTPDLFSATPAYSALSVNGVPAGLGGTGPSVAAGKKRTNEDMLNNTAPAAVMQAQQRPDLFRSRQAAKQSRMR
jgi:Suppressor of forked protein (Suf)